DVTDVVDLARTLGEALGVSIEVAADTAAPFHPGRCARITLSDGTLVGHVGELHPKAVAALGLPARAVGGELDLDVLTLASEGTPQARTVHTFPLAQSDVAVVIDEDVPAARVAQALRGGAGETLESLTLFDVYRGDQVGEGRKSLAYRLTFRAPDRTLTTDEVSGLRDRALAAAAQAVGAVQRA
ncbi:MAG TPA: phenylalanine--tRNA ligase subunit beta, partial [Ornithinibacter sp.]|nr:phenylalanine--tRNA ligase subunit beta [Ornithinibacter sp.]